MEYLHSNNVNLGNFRYFTFYDFKSQLTEFKQLFREIMHVNINEK